MKNILPAPVEINSQGSKTQHSKKVITLNAEVADVLKKVSELARFAVELLGEDVYRVTVEASLADYLAGVMTRYAEELGYNIISLSIDPLEGLVVLTVEETEEAGE